MELPDTSLVLKRSSFCPCLLLHNLRDLYRKTVCLVTSQVDRQGQLIFLPLTPKLYRIRKKTVELRHHSVPIVSVSLSRYDKFALMEFQAFSVLSGCSSWLLPTPNNLGRNEHQHACHGLELPKGLYIVAIVL